MMGECIVEVLLAPYFERVLHGTTQILGSLMSAQAVGGILGSLAIPRLSKIIAPGRLMGICGLTFSAVIVVFATVPVVPVILPLITIGGAGVSGWQNALKKSSTVFVLLVSFRACDCLRGVAAQVL